ncbi:MAG: T9SS type A sorting domain-containing protein, partial [Saprospiraceae bacterium]|nr:T9SS type A sorting domain-containing protein [Saprospiraceae bacterium]
TAQANAQAQSEDRTKTGSLILQAEEAELQSGQTYELTLRSPEARIVGYQFTLDFDAESLELVEVKAGLASEENFGLALLEEGALTTSWNEAEVRSLREGEELFTLVLRAKAPVRLSEALSITSRYTAAEAYAEGEVWGVELSFGQDQGQAFRLYQNVPNPFRGTTTIGFQLPEASEVTLTITDVSGKVVKVLSGEYGVGYQEIEVSDLQARGVLYYQLETATHTATRKMIITN